MTSLWNNIPEMKRPMHARLQALEADLKWETANAFALSNYPNGGSIKKIPTGATPMDWYIADEWDTLPPLSAQELNPGVSPFNFHRIFAPDISNLVQYRVSQGDYPSNSSFGVVLDYIDGYQWNTENFRRMMQAPDDWARHAILYVEWDDEPEHVPSPTEWFTSEFKIKEQKDDTWSVWGPGINGNYWDGSKSPYIGPNCEEDPVNPNEGVFKQIIGGVPHTSYWRWNLSDGAIDIPRGAIIDSASLTVKCHTTSGSPLAWIGLGLLGPAKGREGRLWDGADGFESYGCYLTETQIPRPDGIWWNFGQWTEDVDYDIPPPAGTPDIARFVQKIVDSTWDDKYHFAYGFLQERKYEYKSAYEDLEEGDWYAGDYFGLVGESADYSRTIYQDPEYDDSGAPLHPGIDAAKLYVTWKPRDYHNATYFPTNTVDGMIKPEEDTYTSGTTNNWDADPLLVGNGNKGYWRFGISIPLYSVIQKAALIYDPRPLYSDLPLELGAPVVFRTLYAADGKWNGSSGFKDVVVRDNINTPKQVADLPHYPTAGSLDAIWRVNELGGTDNVDVVIVAGNTVLITEYPETSVDITELVQAYVDYGPYQFGDYFTVVLEEAGVCDPIPEGELQLYVEWMDLHK